MNAKPIVIYDAMRRHEVFEDEAGRLWVMVRHAVREHPGVPRHLHMDIEGHMNARNEYDDEAAKVISFVRAALGPYLTATPWGRTDESTPQSDDLPDRIMLGPTGDGRIMILTGDNDRISYERPK